MYNNILNVFLLYMEKCHICGFTCKSNIKGLLTIHYKNIHNYTHGVAIKLINYYNKNLDFPKCPICGKDCAFKAKNRYYLINKTCGNPECKKLLTIQTLKQLYIDHPEKREARRKSRLEYLSKQENRINTAWYKRAMQEYSYLEKWFIDNVIKTYNLAEKYDIISENVVDKYFLDFAFDNIKLDVELDGRCHFIHGEKRIEHDIERDEYLTNLGWKIYRITFKDVENNAELTIHDFITYLNNMDILLPKRLDYDDIIKYANIKKEKEKIEKNHKEKVKKELDEYKIYEYNNWMNILKQSDIDFKKSGWISKSVKLLNITRKKFYTFLKRTTFILNLGCFVNPNMKGSIGQKWITDENGIRKRIFK